MALVWIKGLLVALALSRPVLSGAPISIPWSNQSFGPEGPWQAVQLRVGASDLGLYSGGDFASCVFNTAFCAAGPSSCPASRAGLYDAAASTTKDDSRNFAWGVRGGVGQRPPHEPDQPGRPPV